ncbi:uncharacterized protein LOC143869752 [Tasmannia lanceolata]|uniref:uncharacterized protein LOC143869752 n=1 Tax=Tasmannia lanceolata TaxID=3420 RepID=UPI0040641C4F
MEPPTTAVEVQRLAGRITALGRFMPKSAEKCQPFFKQVKNIREFEWTPACQEAFKALKQYLQTPPVLAKPEPGEELLLYLAISPTAVSAVLAKQSDKKEHPVYYVSKTLHGAEVRYLNIGKFALAVVSAAWKLLPYFQAHPIILLTDQPFRRILQKKETSGKMVSWAVELGEFDIQVRPRPAIKSLALADFIVESTAPATELTIMENARGPTEQTACEDMRPYSAEQSGEIHWTLHVDGSAGKTGRGAGVVLHGSEGFTLEYALRLDFKASNNEDEYEALLAGLSLTTELGTGKLKVYSDSQLVVNQVNGAYEARGLRMKRYLQKVKEKLQRMGEVEILQVPRDMNNRADALPKMASEETHDFGTVLTEVLLHPSINEVQVLEIPPGPNWMDLIMRYLKDGILPEDKLEARRLTARAARYVVHGPRLYK